MRYTTLYLRPLARPLAWMSALAAAAMLAACDVTAPLPEGAVATTPPAQFATWWSMVESCSGHARPMSQISWYVTPGNFQSQAGGKILDGAFRHHDNEIILSEDVMKNGPIVRHEMLHAIIESWPLSAGHPREFYLRRCAGVVDCNYTCVQDSPPPNVNLVAVPVVSPSKIDVTIKVDTVVRMSSHPGSWIAVTVRARNTEQREVRVQLPPTYRAPMSFSLKIDAPVTTLSRWVETNDYDVLKGVFGAGETKVYVYDLYLPPSAPGIWTVSGAYAGHWMAAPATVRVTP